MAVNIYSTYSDAIPSTLNVDRPANFDLVNWVLNENYLNEVAADGQNFTAGDIQLAIWKLIDNNETTVDLNPFSPTRAQEIYDDVVAEFGMSAINNPMDSYTPGFGDTLAVLAVPVTSRGTFSGKQIIIMEVDMPTTATLTNLASASITSGNVTQTVTASADLNFDINLNAPPSQLDPLKRFDFVGGASADVLFGTDKNDTFNGLAGRDTLTGNGGSDIFKVQFGQSLWSASDTITDLVVDVDKIDILNAGATVNIGSLSWATQTAVSSLTSTSLTNVINSVFADKNGALAGLQTLGVNEAALVNVTIGSSPTPTTYLIVNGGQSTFETGVDTVINVTGYQGSLPTSGAITPSLLFVTNP
jgi:hypothetical protein